MPNTPDAKPYLEYLDKEMTIMGVLSAFAASALAAVLWKMADAEPSKASLVSGLIKAPWFIIVATALNLLSALAFYRQRSLLAWHYGQIALTAVGQPGKTVEEQSQDADGWDTWVHHWRGWAWLSLGFLGYGLAFSIALLRCGPRGTNALFVGYGIVTALAIAGLEQFVNAAKEHPLDEDPFQVKHLLRLRRFKSRRTP